MSAPAQAVYRWWAVRAIAIVIGVVFAYAGQAKIMREPDLAAQIASLRLLPPALDNWLAIGLPPYEILLGGILISGWQPRTAAFCALLTTGVFLVALISASLQGIPVECGCFGATGGDPSSWHQLRLAIVRDLILLAGALVAYLDAWNRTRARINSPLFHTHLHT